MELQFTGRFCGSGHSVHTGTVSFQTVPSYQKLYAFKFKSEVRKI